MALTLLAFVYLAALYLIIILVTWQRGIPSVGTSWGRRNVLHTSVQPAEIPFTLKEGQTIVGVLGTTRALCFYIDHERRDDKTYK